MDVLDLLNEKMGMLLIQLDNSITLFFGITWDSRSDWKERQQRKLVFLIDLIGGEFNLLPIFDSENDFCSAVRHAIVGKDLLECSAADLPMVEEWMDFFDEAADEGETQNEDGDGCLTEGNAKTGNSVCYADYLSREIHRNAADAMAAFERRLDGMVGRCS